MTPWRLTINLLIVGTMSNRLALVTLHYCVPACNCVATTAVGLCPVLQRGEKKVASGSEEIVTYLKEQVRGKTSQLLS